MKNGGCSTIAFAALALLLPSCSERARAPGAAGEGHDYLPSPAVATGSCSFEGAVRACRVRRDSPGGGAACFEGTQTCASGVWTECAGSGAYYSLTSRSSSSSGGAQTKSLSTSVFCDNPCDPDCREFREDPGDAGVSPEAGGSVSGSFFGDVDDLPNGWENKLLRDMAHSPARKCTSSGYCNADHYCKDPPGNFCEPFREGQTTSCGLPEYTAPIACKDSAGNFHVPICNRGQVDAPAGVPVTVFKGSFGEMLNNIGACRNEEPTKVGPDFWCKLSRPIPKGTCVELMDSECTKPLSSMEASGGKRLILANAPKEDTDGVYEKRPECECANNWSVYDKGGDACAPAGVAYAPLTYKQTYTASCPIGSRAAWAYLAYSLATPSNGSGASSIRIQAHTADSPGTLSPTCADCVTVADVPSPNPEQSCSLTGPSPCPRNLYAALGPKATQSILELVFTLAPTPDGGGAPKLHNWRVTYNCIESE